MVQAKCSVTKLFEIEPEKFNPAPKVTSAFISLRPHQKPLFENALEPRFDEVVRYAFSQPRKTLANNLKKIFTSQQIEALDINPGIRPQNINISELIRLAQSHNP
jgi:16S rRNA (adenine1518-N6/adenine1519-N6)-dimethyltransferase